MILPFAEPNPFLEKIGFRLYTLELDKNSDGWLRIHVKWGIGMPSSETNRKSEKSYILESKTKYPVYNGKTSGSGEYVNLAFPDFGKSLKYKTLHRVTLDIGIHDSKDYWRKIPYDYRFFENIKYGANIYFSPKEWNSGPDTPIAYYNIEDDGEYSQNIFMKKIAIQEDGFFVMGYDEKILKRFFREPEIYRNIDHMSRGIWGVHSLMKVKYIIHNGFPVIFSGNFNHDYIMEFLGKPNLSTSAGFVNIRGGVSAYGRSESLNIGGKEQDSIILRNFLINS